MHQDICARMRGQQVGLRRNELQVAPGCGSGGSAFKRHHSGPVGQDDFLWCFSHCWECSASHAGCRELHRSVRARRILRHPPVEPPLVGFSMLTGRPRTHQTHPRSYRRARCCTLYHRTVLSRCSPSSIRSTAKIRTCMSRHFQGCQAA